MSEIKKNFEDVKNIINNIIRDKKIEAEKIKLIAVTKTHSVEIVDEAMDCGICVIGENKIQEASEKLPQLKNQPKEFHFIGHLQSNKISKLLELKPFLIHSIDKYSTAKKLNEKLIKLDLTQKILIQVNTSFEESKFGIAPEDSIEFVKKVSELSQLRIIGLMTIGKFTDVKEEIRESFRLLRGISKEISEADIPNVKMQELSMGMSNDYEIALEEGATLIRVGSAIFGKRNYLK